MSEIMEEEDANIMSDFGCVQRDVNNFSIDIGSDELISDRYTKALDGYGPFLFFSFYSGVLECVFGNKMCSKTSEGSMGVRVTSESLVVVG